MAYQSKMCPFEQAGKPHPTSLKEFYEFFSADLPSFGDRAILYEKFGLGQKEEYYGNFEQNLKLLKMLLKEVGCDH